MARLRLTVLSPLPREDCLRRLQEQVDPEGSVLGKKLVIGRVRDRSLRLRKRIKGRNSFQTFLFAGVAAVGSQTRFECRFGMHPAVIAFMAFWFAALLVIGVMAVSELGSVWAGSGSFPAGVPIGAFVLGMAVFGIGVIAVGRFTSKGDVAFLTEFLLNAVNGRIQAPAAVSPARR
jgi:hypothetical protein